MRVLLVFFLATTWFTGPTLARFDVSSYQEWSALMIGKLPFRNGTMTREDYSRLSQAYLNGLIGFYEQIAERKADISRGRRHPGVSERVKLQLALQIDRARRYVKEAEEGLFSSLDPQNTGVVTETFAWSILNHLAEQADFNRNGLLEPIEADIAEAALVRGVDLADTRGREQLLQDMDRGAFRSMH